MSGPFLTTPHGFKERILLFGGGGVGKTTSVLSIARRLTRGVVWVIDNDYSYAYARALETDFADVKYARLDDMDDFPGLDPATRVVILEVGDDWADMRKALDYVLRMGDQTADWLVIDSLSPTWDAVQTWYTQQVMDSTFAEYLVKVRANTDNMSDFNKVLAADGRWQFINKEYMEGFYGPIRKWKGHLLLTAESKALSSQADDGDKSDYGFLGVMPVGQKRLKHLAHTNLFLAKRGHGAFVLTTVKDRNREDQDGLAVNDFAMDYLRGVAGWKLELVGKAPAVVS